MTDQPTLFDPVPPAPPATKRRRHRTATTSADAWADVQPVRGKQQQAVLDALRAYGAMTRQAIAAATGLPLASVCGRVHELVKRGDVYEVIEQGRRLTRDGCHVVAATIPQTQRRAG